MLLLLALLALAVFACVDNQAVALRALFLSGGLLLGLGQQQLGHHDKGVGDGFLLAHCEVVRKVKASKLGRLGRQG